MTLSAGTRLGPYEILAPIGAGGMGEVYKAKDTRLDRTVAVKVLPSHLSENQELKARFEREARAISALSHPHICALFDVGNEGGVEYLVMEYLEGETLADRLTKGALANEQVLKLGIEIAGALDKAHKQGIVHRDLKPGNIMLTKSGVKLLDFGLAKHVVTSVEKEISQLSSLPTEGLQQQALTEQGTILGTFQYMSPEQLEGKEADARTDIFAFGCVLYEMASGRKAFSGKSRASMIAAILEREPPAVSSIAPMTPPAFDRVVKTCLAKEPDDRFQTAHDVKLQLEWIAEGGSQAGIPAPVAARRRSRDRALAVAAAGFAALALALALALVRNFRGPAAMVQSSILPPEKSHYDFASGAMVISPDATKLAFIAPDANGKNMLWVRPLSGLSAQALSGTQDAIYPFWSPDSRFIGFFAAGKLKKIESSGGPAESLAEAPQGRGGSWNREGFIVFAPNFNGALSRVAAGGGTAQPATKLDEASKETTHRWPFFLPDGKHFLYLGRSASPGATSTQQLHSAIFVSSNGEKPRLLVASSDSQPVYAPPGYLLYVREGTLMAQPFSAGKLKTTGDAFPVAEHVQDVSGYNYSIFSASNAGSLVYAGGGSVGASQLAWYDRNGRQIEAVGAPGLIARPKLSHDGKKVAIDIRDPASGNVDVWIDDLARRTLTRLTFDPAADTFPLWSPDDSRIVFISARKGLGDLFSKSSSGTGGEDEVLVNGALKLLGDWSNDGRTLVFEVRDPKVKASLSGDLGTYSFADRKASPYVQSELQEGEPQFSPDAKWVVYVSGESGKNEIYVRSYPDHGGKWQVSTAGGEDPRWGSDGKEIFYVAPGNKLTAVSVNAGASFEAGIPQPLFEARFRQDSGPQYDVTADGKRFLIDADVEEQGVVPVTLVQNWLSGRERK